MKISSVSKKVLSGALSAAMVVAFAPTVAFATDWTNTGDITVHYNLNGGAFTSGNDTSIADTTAKVSGSTLTITSVANPTNLEKAGMKFAGWFYDADGDGVQSKDAAVEPSVATNTSSVDGTLDVANIAEAGEITLSAKWDYANTLTATPAINTAAKSAVTSVDVSTTGSFDTSKLTVTCPDGTAFETAVGTVSNNNTSWNVDLSSHLQSGEYTVQLKDAAGNVTGEKTFKLFKVTLDAGSTGYFKAGVSSEYYVSEGTQYSALTSLAEATNTDDKLSFAGYRDIAGSVVADNGNKTITSDITLSAFYSNPQVNANAYAGANALSFNVANTGDLDGKSNAAVKDFTATIEGPDGFSKSWKIVKGSAGAVNGTVTVNFGSTKEGYEEGVGTDRTYYTTTKLAAGTYTLSIKANKVSDEQYASAKIASIASGSIALAGVSVDLDGGTWTKTADELAEDTNYKAVTEKLLQVNAANLSDIKTALDTLMKDTYVKAPKGKVFDGYTVNGIKNSAKWGVATAEGVAVKAVYKDAAEEIAPTVASIEKQADGKYKLTFTAPEGSKLQYAVGNNSYKAMGSDSSVTVAATDTLKVKAVKANTTAKELEFSGANASVASFDAFAISALNAKTSDGKTIYNSKLTTAKADGEAALKAIGYAEKADWETAVKAQEKAVVEAIAAHATSELDAKKALTISKDGKTYTYMTDAAYADAVKAVNEVVAAFDVNNDEDKANDVKVNKKSNPEGADYAADITAAVTSAKTISVAAEDVDAAAAVDTAIAALPATDSITAENYQAALDAAEAAEKAYDALTADQKKLVTASVTGIAKVQVAALTVKADEAEKAAAAAKAEAEQAKTDAEAAKTAAAEAAAKAKAAQDELAAAKAKGASKTVAASKKTKKTTKKYTLTVTAADSESGEAAKTAKVSASKGLTVSGKKVTLKKGAKKGTYTAKVKVTVGEYSNTVKVTFKVK